MRQHHFSLQFTVSSILLVVSAQYCQALRAEDAPRTVGKVERLDPALDQLIPPGAQLEVIGEGYKWCEGPCWIREAHFLLFSDTPTNTIMRWDNKTGSQPYLKPSGYTGKDSRGGESGSNGLTLDRQGRLILCQHGDRRVARLESSWDKPEPKYVTLADKYEGKRLNSPNDAIVDSKGAIYFTDPPYGLEMIMEDPKKELDFQGVYRISPDGKLTLLTKDLERPNGIALSPDEKRLYVANSHEPRPIIMAFPVNADGTIGEGKEFYNAKKANTGGVGACDGLTCDKNGIVFATIPGGVGVFTADGKQLGLLNTGVPTSNCKFGEDGATLFITANPNLLRIKTNTKGVGY